MVKVEAKTVEQAYALAANKLGCSIAQINYEIVQYPSKGFLGLFAKPAIIVASLKQTASVAPVEKMVADEIIKELHDMPSGLSEDESSAEKEIDAQTVEPIESAEKEELFSDPDMVVVAKEIEQNIKALLDSSCYKLDTVEVDVRDGFAYIFIDGEDTRLLVGKKGHRYNSFWQMLDYWINCKYQLKIKLEVGNFLTSQYELVERIIEPTVQDINSYGRARTNYLDGIRLTVALELLREKFPNMYVAVRRSSSGDSFIIAEPFRTNN